LTIVPRGTIMAGLAFGGIAWFNLDGSGFRVLSDITTATIRWAPSGTQAVFTESPGGGASISGPIAVIDTASSVRLLDSLPSGLSDANPIYSRDGASIYFNRTASPDTIWRMHADGTGIAMVEINTAGNYFWPTPSPDGSQLAVVDLNSGTLEVVNLASGAVTNLNVVAQTPQWSPGSDLIAYIATASGSGPIAVVHADGSGQRVVVGGNFSPYFDWSPDGNWLVAWDAYNQRLDVLSADSGLVLPLDYASYATSPTILPSASPTWQPTPTSPAAARFHRWQVPSKSTAEPRGKTRPFDGTQSERRR
jgi:Tol biopolymer transport system component